MQGRQTPTIPALTLAVSVIIAVFAARAGDVIAFALALGLAGMAWALRDRLRQSAIGAFELRERIKEQQCLYGVSALLFEAGEDAAGTLQRVADLLPTGWQFPDRTVARVRLSGLEARSSGFVETQWCQRATVRVDDVAVGAIEIFLLDAPAPGSPPFLVEEQKLLDVIADGVAQYHRRRSAEGAVQRSEAFYRSLIDNATEVTSVLAEDGTTIFVSPTIRRLGYTPEEQTGTNAFALVHAEDLASVKEAFAEILSGERGDRPVEYRVRTKSGQWRWFESTGNDLREDPAVRAIVVNSRDVTDRHEAEARIRLQAHLLDAVGQAVVATDARDRITYMNRAAERLYRRTIQEARGSAITALIGTERPLYESASDGWVREGGVWSGEFTVRRRDGSTFPAYGTESPILDEAGRLTGFVTVAVDITERKQAELKLREQEERLQQGRKLEAVGQLAGGVAHDFNNLLTGIQGFTQLALEVTDLAPKVRADLEEVRRSADRAASLTRQLLAFSRRQVLQSADIDLNDVVRETHRLLGRLIGEDIQLATRLAKRLGTVHADAGQIEQVLVNLVLNARDAMPGGGRVVIETRNATITEKEATRHAFEVRSGRFVQLGVRDTGVGMDGDTLRRVFEPFFTTKEQGKGTGLGLSTVYGIVKQSGGYIWLDSERGHGTTVRVYLPRVDGKPAPAEREKSEAPERGTETVLLVEDDDTVRALARRVLQRQGYEVLEARNGVEALRIAEPADRPIDLVLSDIVMPELGGRQLVEQLQRIRPGLPVLLMSGYTDDAAILGGEQAADMFLAKPFTTEMLARRVRAALDRTPT